MPEQQAAPRIPEIRPQMGHQVLQAVDDSYLTMNPEPADRAVAPWVKRYHRYLWNQEMGVPPTILEGSKKLMSAEKLAGMPAEYLEQPGVAYSFDRLITNYAYESGQLKEVVDALQVKSGELKPELRLLDLVLAGDRKPTKPYQFSRVFLGLDREITNDELQKLIELHSEALDAAQERLDSWLPTLKEDFYTKLEKLIDAGVLPKNITIPNQAGDLKSDDEGRLAQLEVIASDPIVNRLSDRGGHYDAKENAIYIDADRIFGRKCSQTLIDTYTHEMLHAHSGHTVVLDGKLMFDEYDEDEDRKENIYEGWAGVGGRADISIVYRNAPDVFNTTLEVTRVGLVRKVNTVNEAYAEWATMELTDKSYNQEALWSDFEDYIDEVSNGGDLSREYQSKLFEQYGRVYLPNRIVMAGLVAHGIDPLLIGEANFESYEPKLNNPEREAGQTAPARRALDAAISQITPYKSLEQLQKRLLLQARERWPESKRYADQVWGQTKILSEILRNSTEEPNPSN